MKLIIAGSRTLKIGTSLIDALFSVMNLNGKVSEIVSGTAPGVDTVGDDYAKLAVNYPMKLKEFPADWDKYGKSAGPIRNKQMAEYADALLLIWDGASRGSDSMKREMEKLYKPIYEIIIKSPYGKKED